MLKLSGDGSRPLITTIDGSRATFIRSFRPLDFIHFHPH
jgi:hypothetical protein